MPACAQAHRRGGEGSMASADTALPSELNPSTQGHGLVLEKDRVTLKVR